MLSPQAADENPSPASMILSWLCPKHRALLPAIFIGDCAACDGLDTQDAARSDETLLERLCADAEHYTSVYHPAFEHDSTSFEQGVLWAAKIASRNAALLRNFLETNPLGLYEADYIDEWVSIFADEVHDD